ncbi:hypothetical protein HLV35_07435 [Eggerthellaceae bacterium zg-997]|nr:hypothetical protein [Eggerthellaceae bacterium zg-997]
MADDREGLGPFGAAALGYAESGWAVLPLAPRGKRPATAHGVSDATTDPGQVAAGWRAVPDMNVGVACGAPSGGLVVIDVDVDDERGLDGHAALYAWEREHGELPETCSVKTGRGGTHLLYVADREVRPSANPELGIDVRGDGSYVMAPPSVHPNGREVAWETPPWEVPPAAADGRVMAFIEHVRPAADRAGEGGRRPPLALPERVGEGARDETMFRAACSMVSRRMPESAVTAACLALNAERFDPPMSEAEVRAKVRSAMRYEPGTTAEREAARRPGRGGAAPDGGGAGAGLAHGRLTHVDVAERLIEEHGACLIDGVPAVSDGTSYATGWDAVQRRMLGVDRAIRTGQQREVMHYLSLTAPRRDQSRPTLVAFDNGVLDVETGELMAFDKSMVIPNVIPHAWRPGAEAPEVDGVLARIACGDPDVLRNLVEALGMCAYRSSEFGQAPILLGSGSNGKSTYIRMVRAMLGEANVSSLDLGDMGRRFYVGELVGKLANLGDDISNEFQNGDTLALFKKVTTGERVYADVKGSRGFQFNPYCTLVFSANEFPRVGDSTEGMMRRLYPIEFNARFSRRDADYNPRIAADVTSEAACERLCVLAVEGIRSLIANNGFSACASSARQLEAIHADNDTVLMWLIDEERGADDLAGSAVAFEYGRYRDWAEATGVSAVSRPKFTRRVNAQFGFKVQPTWRDDRRLRVFFRDEKGVASA